MDEKETFSEGIKRIITIFLFVIICLGFIFTFVGCSSNSITNSDDSNEQQPTQGDSNEEENEYACFSETLQKVLTDITFNGNAWRYFHDPNVRHTAAYDPVPYGFLEHKGYDIIAIQDNRIKHVTQVYTKKNNPNKIYVDCKVEHKSTTDYYACYVLEYDITDKEIAELDWLYRGRYVSGEFYSYCQAPQFIQALSYVKTPKLLNESYMTEKAIEGMKEVTKKKPFSTGNGNVTLLSIEDASEKYPIQPPQYIYPHYYVTFAVKSNGYYGIIKMLATSKYFLNIDNKTVLNSSCSNIYEPEWKEEYLNSKEEIAIYDKRSNMIKELVNIFKYNGGSISVFDELKRIINNM